MSEIALMKIEDAIAFGKQKVAEASEVVEDQLVAGKIPDPVREESEDIPITIHGDNGQKITISISQYYMIGEKIQDQIMKRNTAELCFTNIALAARVEAEEGFDRSEPIGSTSPAAGLLNEGEEKEEDLDPILDEPYEEPEYVSGEDIADTGLDESIPEEADKKDETPGQQKKGKDQEKGGPARTPGARTSRAKASGRTNSRTKTKKKGINNRLAAGKEGQKYKLTITDKNGNRTTKIVTMTKIPKTPAVKKTQEVKVQTPDIKKAQDVNAHTPGIKDTQSVSTKTNTHTEKANNKEPGGIRRVTLNEAQALAVKQQQAFELMAQAAAITDMSGRDTSFENKDGQRLVFKKEFDSETGQKIPKAFIGGKEVDAAKASAFIMGVMAGAHPKVAENIKYIVGSAVKNPDINREYLEKAAAMNLGKQQSQAKKDNMGR